tara:strand:- start:10928 stop:12157 length:1230 start_codon:yes stop_codon:yes gene_type:complete
VINLNSFKAISTWWIQFPIQLKLITKIRFFASFGAGGVIYLTSLIFNNIGLTATEIGFGFTLSAIVGTVTRFITGDYLNKNKNINLPLKVSSILSIIASLLLIFSKDTFLYILGQSFIGAAAGVYWPTAELAVPYLCKPLKTSKAYALVRSSEALGIFMGVLIGSILNSFIYFKFIYLNDILCMFVIIFLISNNKKIITIALDNYEISNLNENNKSHKKWHKDTKIIIFSILLMTTCLALIQVTLPLDFVKGGIWRESISKSTTSFIISVQLIFLFIFQWPIGNWLSKKSKLFGLKVSLANFGISTFLLYSSSYFKDLGIIMMLIGIIFCSIGISSFLPTSTEIMYSIAPINKKGFALALLSQCFALGYFLGPLISGRILDTYGNASIIWISISILCLVITTSMFSKKY